MEGPPRSLKKGMRLAAREALRSTFKSTGNKQNFKLGAVLIKGGSVVSTGRNKNAFSSLSLGHREHLMGTCHAELDAIKNVSPEVLKKSSLFIARVNKEGEYRMSKPCSMCQRILMKSGIKKVYYTTDKGIERWK